MKHPDIEITPPRSRLGSGFASFLRDKLPALTIAVLAGIVSVLTLAAFKFPTEGIAMLGLLWLAATGAILAYEYLRRRRFYRDLLGHISRLDQAYLVLETLAEPEFYDGEILYRTLYEINKSMAENIAAYRSRSHEFQEYVELWIHEVKTPLATLSLIANDPRVREQVRRLDDYVEQILYFARAETAERDYIIRRVSLADLVGRVASRDREILLARHISLDVRDLDYTVRTDAKWCEFILGQILANSIKYDSTSISIRATRRDSSIILSIRDNGIGIASQDLPRVFDKSFTGTNGRTGRQSTGMGLYIAETLCRKLGHRISIDSVLGEWTEVRLVFGDTTYYDVVDSAGRPTNLTKK